VICPALLAQEIEGKGGDTSLLVYDVSGDVGAENRRESGQGRPVVDETRGGMLVALCVTCPVPLARKLEAGWWGIHVASSRRVCNVVGG